MRVVVCVPTYDERENLEPLVRRLGAVLAGMDVEGHVVVVDDASPDGTGELANGLARELPWLSVLRRPRKEGLGPAYVEAFRRALAEGGEVIVEMDCDFSHDPGDVPRLVAALADADVAIGSRYVAGGAVRDWGPLRRALSRFGSLYARVLLGIDVADPTSGFKGFRREVLEGIELDAIRSRGYAFQVETTYRALRRGFRVAEIPIVFTERAVGESKMTTGIALEAAARVPALRLRALRGRL